MKRIALFVFWVLAACEEKSGAAEPGLPAVDFIAEGRKCITIRKEETCSNIAIYYTPRRWRVVWRFGEPSRTEEIFDIDEGTLTTILHHVKEFKVERHDFKEKVYIGIFLMHATIGERVGTEVVEGRATVKYRFALDGRYGGTPTESISWVTSENIVVREESKVGSGDDLNVSVTQVTKLTIGSFDSARLEALVPPDYKRTK